MYEQSRHAANDWCVLWRSYEKANDWKIFQLEPVNEEEEKGARDSIRCVLNTLEARMSLIIREGEVEQLEPQTRWQWCIVCTCPPVSRGIVLITQYQSLNHSPR